MSLVYMDTSSWNAACKRISRHGKTIFLNHEYLFSSCNLDEFVLASFHVAKDLATCAWRLSNRKKLLDHIEMTVMEINCYLSGIKYSYYDNSDENFFKGWDSIKRIGPNKQLQDEIRYSLDDTKRMFKNHLMIGRKFFNPLFKMFARFGLKKSWKKVLAEMEDDGNINKFIHDILYYTNLLGLVSNPKAIFNIPYTELPCTACWVQYYVALSYAACFESGKQSKPNYGDQFDYRHACYAGIADIFVTNDKKMYDILINKVYAKRSKIIFYDDFISSLENC